MAMMAESGARVENENYRRLRVPPNGAYPARDRVVEGDYSSASFFFQAAAVCGTRVEVTGLNPNSLLGDRRFPDLLESMGCAVSRRGRAVVVEGRALRAVDAGMADTPDLVPPLAVVAAFAEGTSRLRNVSHLRHKECDRLAAIISELGKMGIHAALDGDALVIEGGAPHGAAIDSHNDHRIAMSFAVAGLATGGQTINGDECAAKSFPDFWERLEALQ